MRNALRDLGKADPSVEEQTDGRFICTVEHRAAVALEGGGLLCEIQRRERLESGAKNVSFATSAIDMRGTLHGTRSGQVSAS